MLGWLIVTAFCLEAAQLKEARVTYVVNDIKLISAQAAPLAATVGKSVRDGDAIGTGAASRSELILADQAIVRLGPKTTVSFGEATRTNLGEGAMLFLLMHHPQRRLQSQ